MVVSQKVCKAESYSDKFHDLPVKRSVEFSWK
jgi:hypothetical protein